MSIVSIVYAKNTSAMSLNANVAQIDGTYLDYNNLTEEEVKDLAKLAPAKVALDYQTLQENLLETEARIYKATWRHIPNVFYVSNNFKYEDVIKDTLGDQEHNIMPKVYKTNALKDNQILAIAIDGTGLGFPAYKDANNKVTLINADLIELVVAPDTGWSVK